MIVRICDAHRLDKRPVKEKIMVGKLIRAKLHLKNNLQVDCHTLRFILMRWTVIYIH